LKILRETLQAASIEFVGDSEKGQGVRLWPNPDAPSGACMSQPIWAPAWAVCIIYDRQIARHGGASGLRDEGLLQNALQRPVNKWQYEDTYTFECAVAYAFGIAKAYAFVDGNKRTAFVRSVTFLRLNGWHFVTELAEGVAFMEDLALGAVSEERFKNWLEQSSTKIK
jgi:death on curing protein